MARLEVIFRLVIATSTIYTVISMVLIERPSIEIEYVDMTIVDETINLFENLK